MCKHQDGVQRSNLSSLLGRVCVCARTCAFMQSSR